MAAGEWTVEGVLLCPRCTLYIDFDGTPQQLQQAISAHDCRAETRYED